MPGFACLVKAETASNPNAIRGQPILSIDQQRTILKGETKAELLDQYNRYSSAGSIYEYICIMAKQLRNSYFSNIFSRAGDYLMKGG